MRHMKKTLSLLMALAMLVSLFAVTAFAEGTGGTITIENTTSGKTYSIYKVFDATYSSTDAASYTIKTGDAWYNLVKDEDGTYGSPFQLSTGTVGTTDDTYTVTLKSGKTGNDVLQWFNGLTAAGSSVTLPTPTKTETGTGGGESETAGEASNALTFTGLDNGYYYVTSELGALITLTNLNNTAEIVDKNQTPSWDNGDGDKGGKFVQDGTNDDGSAKYVTSNTAAIGETLHYQVKVNAAPNYTADGQITEFQIVDTEGAAIYVDFHTMVVKVDGKEIEDGWIQGFDSGTSEGTTATSWHKVESTDHTTQTDTPDYKWYIENKTEDDAQFTIHIKWIGADGKPLYPEKSVSTIEITYDATLRENATVGKDTSHNTNKATLKWVTDKNTVKDDGEKTVTTTTFGFAVEKKDGTTRAALAGVEFQLKEKDGTSAIEVYPSKSKPGRYYVAKDENGDALSYTNFTDVDTGDGKETTTLVTNSNGKFVVVGLKGGNYVLTETKPLDGYNSIADTNIELKVPTEENQWSDVGGESALVFTVNNFKGTVLPETGSTGTRLFILFGALAAVGAGIFLVSNKRMSKEGF